MTYTKLSQKCNDREALLYENSCHIKECSLIDIAYSEWVCWAKAHGSLSGGYFFLVLPLLKFLTPFWIALRLLNCLTKNLRKA